MKHLLYLIVFCFTILSCDKQDNASIAEFQKNFTVDLQVVTEGFDGEKCWFQPRIAYTGQEDEYSLIMQPWYTSASDYFGTYHEMHSYDGGNTWSAPSSLEEALGDKYVGDTLYRIADVNAQYHPHSNTILAVGGVVRYLNGKSLGYVQKTCYFNYSSAIRKYSSYKILDMPDDPIFSYSYPGCSQWVDLPNGDILQPFRMWIESKGQFCATVARLRYNGEELSFKNYGNVMSLDRGRGLYEPSLIEFKGKYYLTLRNDVNGVVTVSEDGLNYKEPVEWKFDNDSLVWTENTQQHWVKSPWALYLVYTSSHRDESANVMRGRAPLFIAQFDEKRMVLLKNTERVLVPNTGVQLGNFGAFDVSETESWVVTSEATTTETQKNGDNNGKVYIARIKWY